MKISFNGNIERYKKLSSKLVDKIDEKFLSVSGGRKLVYKKVGDQDKFVVALERDWESRQAGIVNILLQDKLSFAEINQKLSQFNKFQNIQDTYIARLIRLLAKIESKLKQK